MMIGTVLQDKYKIERKIGQGGFGAVYRGFDTKLKRPVAIKILTEVGTEGSFQKRFLRECESMARLNHPNIVTVFDCGECDGRLFMVMELVSGPSLLELARKTALGKAQICSFALEICRAMAYAHQHGIIHRDLTLKNILVNSDQGEEGQIKILDFGLAKLIHTELETTGKAMVGTPYYMAPEQIRGEGADERVDIFSFGVGIYRLLNGHFPFEAEHPTALMYLILNEEHMDFVDGVPDELKEVLLGCLQKDPRLRPRGFAELAKEFEILKKICIKLESESSVSFSGLSVFAERSSKRNPYLNRIMIKHPNDFFGREREIRKIYSRLDAPHPQSISIVGERRIGKSSLLNFIYHSRNRKRHMQNHKNAIFVYLDFQQGGDFDVPKFIDFLFSMFSYETGNGRDYNLLEKKLDKLKEVIHELHDEGKRIIILMDEFEVITRNEKFGEDFFSFMRSLANSYRVSYVTSSCEELQLMCHNKDISDSPFFNIFSNLPLRPFSREEALELITVPSKTEGVPLEPYAQKIIELAGYFPLFLQIACCNVFEYLVDNIHADLDWRQVSRTFKDEAYPHYSFLWERMTDAEKENLQRIASRKPTSKKHKFVNEKLLRRGYLLESGGELEVCSASFRDFVLEQTVGSEKKSIFSSLWGRVRGKED